MKYVTCIAIVMIVCLSGCLIGSEPVTPVPTPEIIVLDGQTIPITSDSRVTWTQFGPGMSGYNEGTWYHPTDPDYVYITPDMYNTYFSPDAGSSWHTVRDYDGTYTRADRFNRVYDMDFSRQDEDFGMAVNRLGLWYTTDKGRSWAAHELNDSNFWMPDHWGDFLSAVAFDPTDDNIIYIGSGRFWNVKNNQRTYKDLYGDSELNPGRIWRSNDRGQTFRLINQGIDPDAQFGKIIVDPVEPSTVYAATTHGFYRSDNSGDSWSLHNNGLDNGMIRDLDMFYDASTGERIFYVIDQVIWEPDANNNLHSSGGIFISYDQGASWSNITSNLGLNLQALDSWLATNSLYHNRGLARWFGIAVSETHKYALPDNILQSFNRLTVDPRDPDRIYISHNAAHTASFLPDAVWTTQDRGENWYIATRIGQGWQSDAQFWQGRYVPDGVDITSENMEFGHIAARMGNSDYSNHWGVRSLTVNLRGEVLIGYAQQLLRSLDEGLSWQQVDSIETSPGSGNWVGTGSSNLPGKFISQDERFDGHIYLTTGEHGFWKTTDDGDLVYPGAVAVTQISEEAQSPSTIAFHPQDENTIYMLAFRQRYAGHFRRSTDGGQTWENLSVPIPGISNRVHQYSLLIEPDEPDVMYFCVPQTIINDVGDQDAGVITGVYKTSDGGYSWTTVNQGLPQGADVHRLTRDPQDGTLYAAVLRGSQPGGLFKSTNQGQSWDAVAIPHGIEQVNSVHVDAQGNLLIACGTEDGEVANGGVWIRKANGSWQRIFNMPYVFQVVTAAYDAERIMVTVGMNESIDYISPGIYLSEDQGDSWIKINIGIGQPERVMDIAFDLEDRNRFWGTLWGSGFYYAVSEL